MNSTPPSAKRGHTPQWFLRARLKTRQLLLLIALDDHRNLQRAAEAMHLSQPAASKLLKELEDALEVALFERTPRGMTPNWYGESMIRHARMAVTNLNEAHDEISNLRAGRSGTVRMGAISAPAITLAPHAIAAVKQQHPSMVISLQLDTSDSLLEGLQQGKLDICICRPLERQSTAELRIQELVEEPISVVARAGHPLAQQPSLRLADLLPLGWVVLPPGLPVRQRFELAFHEAGLKLPGNLIETTSALFGAKTLQSTDMVGLMATDVANFFSELGLLKILPINLNFQMAPFAIITLAARLPSPAMKVMLQALRASANALYGLKLPLADSTQA